MDKISYSRCEITRDFSICGSCGDYKTMVDCPACGVTFCIVCGQWCEGCGRWVDFSS